MGLRKQMAAIRGRALTLVQDQYELLNRLVFPALAGTTSVRQLDDARTRSAHLVGRIFREGSRTVTHAARPRPARPFPHIQNKSLNFVVRFSGKDAFGRDTELPVVQVLRSLPRMIRFPQTGEAPGTTVVFLSAVISTSIAQLFGGMTVRAPGSFASLATAISSSTMKKWTICAAIEGELAQRRYGDTVRLETSRDCPEDITTFLLQAFRADEDDIYQVNGPVDLDRLMAIYDLVDHPDLKYSSFTPGIPKRLVTHQTSSPPMRKGELLLRHPFESLRSHRLLASGDIGSEHPRDRTDALSNRHGITGRR